MKSKTKILEIAIVLCLVLLVSMSTLPGIAADQNQEMQKVSASEVTAVLEIYGNANEDNTIDMRDFTYTARIICWLEEETDLADANYDGRISVADMTQIGLIILGRESELTLSDSADRTVTIYKPVERVVIAYWIDTAVTLQALKAEDTVVGVTDVIKDETILFPELSKLPSVGSDPDPAALDFEKILELRPDMVFTGGSSANPTAYEEIARRIHSVNPDIAVIFFTFCDPVLYIEEVRKTGYIFDRKEEAEELIKFIEEHLNEIKEKVSNIPEDMRPKVYYEFFFDYYTSGEGTTFGGDIETAGGKNVFDDLSGFGYSLIPMDPEEVINRTPEVIIHHVGGAYAGQVGWGTDDVTALRDKREEIMNRPGFAAIPAVKSGSVYTLASDVVLSPLYPVGIAYYAKWFYPELFEDLDPNAIHQEYLTKFLRIDYDLSRHGVFVYHPEQHPDGR
ncbi:MAG: ABC transporter substrate-binding protein [Halobacteriota archaeon]